MTFIETLHANNLIRRFGASSEAMICVIFVVHRQDQSANLDIALCYQHALSKLIRYKCLTLSYMIQTLEPT